LLDDPGSSFIRSSSLANKQTRKAARSVRANVFQIQIRCSARAPMTTKLSKQAATSTAAPTRKSHPKLRVLPALDAVVVILDLAVLVEGQRGWGAAAMGDGEVRLALGDIRRDPLRLVLREQLRRLPASFLILFLSIAANIFQSMVG
jgi:hypothetical protein